MSGKFLASIDLGSVLGYVAIAYITFMVGYRALTERDWIEAYRNINLCLMLANLVMVTIAITIVATLYVVNQQIFGLSWLNLLGKQGTNIFAIGVEVKYLGIAFCLALMLALPHMAKFEEEIFREGTETWKQGIGRSIAFGFIHMFVGIPLAGAIALTILGLFFTYCYFRGGIKLSTQAHFQSNLLALLILLYVAIAISIS